MREDLTIHTVDTIDEVLRIALEEKLKSAEIETEIPHIWSSDTIANEISATNE